VTSCRPSTNSRHGYTLVEMLVVVVILGIAGAMIIPSMGQVGVLRVQSAVRQIVAQITEAQSDALAYQRGRAIVFDAEDGSYRIVEVVGNTVDVEHNTLDRGVITGGTYGDARMTSVDFGQGSNTLLFDEFGAPTARAGENTPPPTGTIIIQGSGQQFRIQIDGYTGRVTVTDQGVIPNSGGNGGTSNG